MTYPKGWTGSLPLCPLIFSCLRLIPRRGAMSKAYHPYHLVDPSPWMALYRLNRGTTDYSRLSIIFSLLELCMDNVFRSRDNEGTALGICHVHESYF